MAHTAASPATPQSDWYTFLRSAFINGLKAYGASVMVIAPADPSTAATIAPDRNNWTPTPQSACPIHRAVSSRDGWETMNSYPVPAFPTAPLPHAWTRA